MCCCVLAITNKFSLINDLKSKLVWSANPTERFPLKQIKCYWEITFQTGKFLWNWDLIVVRFWCLSVLCNVYIIYENADERWSSSWLIYYLGEKGKSIPKEKTSRQGITDIPIIWWSCTNWHLSHTREWHAEVCYMGKTIWWPSNLVIGKRSPVWWVSIDPLSDAWPVMRLTQVRCYPTIA